jgi:hypothetical protein
MSHVTFLQYYIIILICSFCDPRRALGSLCGFLHLIGHVVGLLWTRDQLVAKASTDTRQQNI